MAVVGEPCGGRGSCGVFIAITAVSPEAMKFLKSDVHGRVGSDASGLVPSVAVECAEPGGGLQLPRCAVGPLISLSLANQLPLQSRQRLVSLGDRQVSAKVARGTAARQSNGATPDVRRSPPLFGGCARAEANVCRCDSNTKHKWRRILMGVAFTGKGASRQRASCLDSTSSHPCSLLDHVLVVGSTSARRRGRPI
jgi:hypothetical protein